MRGARLKGLGGVIGSASRSAGSAHSRHSAHRGARRSIFRISMTARMATPAAALMSSRDRNTSPTVSINP